MTFNYKNTKINYTSKGIGNPIVFLHGFLESSKIWEPFIPALAEKRQVVTLDLPGHGLSHVIDEIHTMELMANVVYELLQHLEISIATFVGHSMGGYVTLAFCELHPEMIQTLVLMNSTPEEDSEERKQNRERAIEIVERNKNTYISMAISNLLSPENNEMFSQEVEKLKADAKTFPKEGITAALKGMKLRTNQINTLKDFNRKKYIILGENDPVMEYKSVKNLAFQCNCELISNKNGHLSYLENSSDIQNFLHFIE